jgi:hypothetical protein
MQPKLPKFTDTLYEKVNILQFSSWIFITVLNRTLILLNTYNYKIKTSTPNPGWRQKITNSLCENFVELSSGAAIYAIQCLDMEFVWTFLFDYYIHWVFILIFYYDRSHTKGWQL